MLNMSATEMIILAVIALLVFGANRLPEAGKAVGKGLREFKRALSDAENSIQRLPPPPFQGGENATAVAQAKAFGEVATPRSGRGFERGRWPMHQPCLCRH